MPRTAKPRPQGDTPQARRTKGNGQGSYVPMPNGDVRVFLSVTDPEGKRRRPSVIVRRHNGKAVSDARCDVALAKLRTAEAKRETERQEAAASALSVTVETYVTGWRQSVLPGMSKVSPATRSNYGSLVEHHIVPGLGSIILEDLRAKQVHDWLGQIVQPVEDGGKGLSKSTARVALTVLSQALQHAVLEDLVQSNVAKAVNVPDGPTKVNRAMDDEQLAAFMDVARSERLAAAWIIGVELGLRPGEVRGLAWSDIDFDAGTLTVRHAQRREEGRLIPRGRVKTPAALRTLALPDSIAEALKFHREDQDAERDAAGERWADVHDLIFTTTEGHAVRQETQRREFGKVQAAAGLTTEGDGGKALPMFVPHEMRHTCSTNWGRKGLRAEVIADLLGHNDGGVLFRKTYRSLTNEVLRDHLAVSS
jgi:integrase